MIKAVPCKQEEEGQTNENVTVGLGVRYKRGVKEEEVIYGPMAASRMTEAHQEKKWVKIFGEWFS